MATPIHPAYYDRLTDAERASVAADAELKARFEAAITRALADQIPSSHFTRPGQTNAEIVPSRILDYEAYALGLDRADRARAAA